MLSSLVEAQARASHQVLHRSRHKDLACCGKCSDPCGNVDGDASHVRFSNLDLAGMQAAANFNVQWADSLGNRASTADRASWPVESGKKSVSKRSNFAAPVTREFTSHGGVMSVQQIVPAVVTHFLSPRGRAHNVCEQNGRKDAVAFCHGDRSSEEFLDAVTNLIMEEEKVILSGQLDQSSTWNVLGKKTSAIHMDERVAGAVNDQRRHMDRGQDIGDVDLKCHLYHGHGG